MKYEIKINGAKRTVEFSPQTKAAGPSKFTINGRPVEADAVRISPFAFSIILGGQSFELTAEASPEGLLIRTTGREFRVEIVDPRSWRRRHGAGIELEGRQQLLAPMPGKVVRVLVAAGQKVEAGQGLLVIEAMKMQNEVRSPKSGTIEKLAREGQTVNAGEILAIVS
jgi:biotin carboxyl carrier protein